MSRHLPKLGRGGGGPDPRSAGSSRGPYDGESHTHGSEVHPRGREEVVGSCGCGVGSHGPGSGHGEADGGVPTVSRPTYVTADDPGRVGALRRAIVMTDKREERHHGNQSVLT